MARLLMQSRTVFLVSPAGAWDARPREVLRCICFGAVACVRPDTPQLSCTSMVPESRCPLQPATRFSEGNGLGVGSRNERFQQVLTLLIARGSAD